MAHGLGEALSDQHGTKMMPNGQTSQHHQSVQQSQRKSVGVMGSRRIFAAAFKLKVLDSYRNDIDCRGNQRATARKYGIHRRQIQKWLQCEENLRSSCAEGGNSSSTTASTTTTTTMVTSTGCCDVPIASKIPVSPRIEASSKMDASPSSASPVGNCSVIGTNTQTSMGTAATATPALNLSLAARLHGDELRQAAPPPQHPSAGTRQSVRGRSSPVHYSQHNSNSNNNNNNNSNNNNNNIKHNGINQTPSHVGYQDQDPQNSRHAMRHDSETRQDEMKYSYVMTHQNYDREVYGSLNDGYYHGLESYQKSASGYRSGSNDNGQIEGSFVSYREKNEVGNEMQFAQTTSFASCPSSSLTLHATTIKSERASPDALATPPGPCETPGSPESASTMRRIQKDYHQQSDYFNRNEALEASVITRTTVLSRNEANLSRVRVNSHPSEISEKRAELRYQTKLEFEEGIRRTRVKEEAIDEIETRVASSAASPTGLGSIMGIAGEPKRETSEETMLEDSRYRESTRMESIAACPDFQTPSRTPTGLSSAESCGPVSPIVRDSAGTYTSLSSPRAASSSGISTSSSCSDSEIDPLDYSSNSARNVGDNDNLSTRRSFSLRFKLDVLDAFHGDIGVAGNQRATARKFGINRRQVQKWLGQESELRGEIFLRGGDFRHRLGPVPEASDAVDLRTSSSTISSLSGLRSDVELENSSSPLYCCDYATRRFGYYRRGSLADSPEIAPRVCNLSCCVDASMMCYHQETSASQRKSYPDQGYCYSPRDQSETEIDVLSPVSSPFKRSACTLSCCYDSLPSPKRACVEKSDNIEKIRSREEQPPQDVPLCLVKPKESFEAFPTQSEPVTSTVPTPPATSASKKDAILFKPYLDNPVSKPTEEHHNVYKNGSQSVIVNNNNNNCQSICNLNKERLVPQHDYALELSLRVPISWGPGYEFPDRLRSAFVRYPTSTHYT